MSEKKPIPLFVIDHAPTIRWPVTVMMPVDGGDSAPFEFTGIFNRLPEEEMDALLKNDVDSTQDRPMQEILRGNAERIPKLLVGWEGVTDTAGKVVEFSEEILKKQIVGTNGQFLSIGLWQAVREIRFGARLGN